MNTEQEIEYYLDSCDPKAVRFHNLDDAIIGVDHNGLLCYSHSLMIDVFMDNDEMTYEEAVEWIDFNVIGTNAGEGFTIIFDD
jgi:hypothetical protein